MYNYNTYNKSIGVIPSVDPVSLALNAATFALPFVVNALQHPAADTRKVVEEVKKQIAGLDSKSRLVKILEASPRMKARDVEIRELLKWYRQNYTDDYKTLSAEDKINFNNYLTALRNNFPNVANMYNDIELSYFTNDEINYGQSTAQSILTNPNTQKYLIYGAIGLGLFLLLRK